LTAFDIAMTNFYAPQSYQKYFLENPIFEAHQTLRLASGFFDFNAVLNTPSGDEALNQFIEDKGKKNPFYQDIALGLSLGALSNAFITTHVPSIINTKMSDFSAHFDALFSRWDKDELADPKKLADSIQQGLPVSFNIKAQLGLYSHCMAISIDKGLAIVTNRGGILDLLTGQLTNRNNLKPGKRLIDVSAHL